MPGFTGVTSIDVSVTAITVRSVEPDMLSDDAVIVVVPPAKADANPLEPDVLLIVATAVLMNSMLLTLLCFVSSCPNKYRWL